MKKPTGRRGAFGAGSFRLAALTVLTTPSVLVAAPTLEQDVLPLLQKHCMGCHGGLKKEAGLDLRTLPAMLRGGESGPAVVKGKPGESELYLLVEEDEMPSGKSRAKLNAEEKSLLKNWIAAGFPTVAERIAKDKKALPAPPAAGKAPPAEVTAAADHLVERRLSASKLKPAPLASDAEFLRRTYLDLTGRIPTHEQAVAFLDNESPDKRRKLVDALLDSPEYGQRFGRLWRDWICPPELPSDMNGGKQPHREARALGDWFAKRFSAGDSWDAIVRDLLTAKGEIKNQPQVVFYGLVGQDAKITPDGAATSVASLFLGVQLQCARCHDDPYRDRSQESFWSLSAFFGGVKGGFTKVEEAAGEGRIAIPKDAFHKAGEKIPVAFLDGVAGPALDQKKSDRRSDLVAWITARDNPYFARAFVNRLWFQLFGRGLVNPVDDMRPLNPPSHPALLDMLAADFSASGFDVKRLVRILCASTAYQRSSLPSAGSEEKESERARRLFGQASIRVLNADALLDSLKLAYNDPKLDLRNLDREDGNTNGESAAVGDEYLEFQRNFETNEEDATDFTHGIPQMLALLNHPRLLQGNDALEEFLKKNPDFLPEQIVSRLYLSTLSRRPSKEEIAQALAYLAKAEQPETARNDLLWSLVNRSEFLLLP